MNTNFHHYINAEIRKFKNDIWIEYLRNNNLKLDEYEFVWIYDNALKFCNDWNKSKCKTCALCDICGEKTLTACDKFEEYL